MILTFSVHDKDNGRTVHSIMRNEMKISSTMIRKLKKSDSITVSGQSVFTNYKLTPGEVVRVDVMGAEPPCDNMPEQGELGILFENAGLIAVNKPIGILVHPSRSRYTGTLSNFVAGYLLSKPHPLPSPPCHAVNRLDRDTSGVVLFAKNSYMKALASDALSTPDVVKEYVALVAGVMPASGKIDVPIKRKEELNMFRIPSPDGQRAVTHYETIRVISIAESSYSVVKFRLETGRTHQIRVHCLHIGHPILGDKLYCNDCSKSISQSLNITTQALHARLLSFTEPLSKQYLEVTADPPFQT